MEAHVGRLRRERGTVLVQVAMSLLVLTAFTAFVVDRGVLWVARAQAQNAADAGALAGATALAFDDLNYPPTTAVSRDSAKLAARCASRSANCATAAPFANPVWPAQAGASSAVEALFECPPGFSGKCVRVNVYRDGSNGSVTLPVFFAPLLGITSRGVRATASARVVYASATNCLRPFSVVDKWAENMAPAAEYNHYGDTGNVLAGTPDQYTPPTSSTPGTGYRLPTDLGSQVVLKQGNPAGNTDILVSGWSLPVRVPDGAGGYLSGGSDYSAAISTCAAGTVAIGDYLPLENGTMSGPTNSGVRDLVALDPGASWNTSTNAVQGSCAPSCGAVSPRVVPISVFDMDEFQWRRNANNWTGTYTDANGAHHAPPGGSCPGSGSRCVRVVNILGFFVKEEHSGDVTGYLAVYPATFAGTAIGVGGGAGFLATVQLVR